MLYPEGEEVSSAPNPIPREQGNEASNRSPVHMDPAEVPTVDFLLKKIPIILRTRRRPQKRILNEVYENLQLERASPEKLIIINKVLYFISENKDDLLNNKKDRLDLVLTIDVQDMLRKRNLR